MAKRDEPQTDRPETAPRQGRPNGPQDAGANRPEDAPGAWADEAAKGAQRGADAATESVTASVDSVAEAMRKGLQASTDVAQRSMDTLVEAMGGRNGPDRNLDAVTRYGVGLIESAQGAAVEYVSWAGRALERQVGGLNEMLRARTPSELAEIQRRLIRDNLALTLESTERVSQIAAGAASRVRNEIGAAGRGDEGRAARP